MARMLLLVCVLCMVGCKITASVRVEKDWEHDLKSQAQIDFTRTVGEQPKSKIH